MKNPDLARFVERGEAAADAARQANADRLAQGAQVARANADYARARHAAWVIVSYARSVAMRLVVEPTIPGAEPVTTDLVVVPPAPAGMALALPEGMAWPEGFVMGPLATGEERKAAAESLAAELLERRDAERNAFSCAKDAVEIERGVVSMNQSFLRAEVAEAEMDGQVGPQRTGSGTILGAGRGPQRGSGARVLRPPPRLPDEPPPEYQG